MKNSSRSNPDIRLKSMLLAFTASLAVPLTPPAANAADEAEKIPAQIIEKSKQLQEKMSGLFHDSWKDLRDSFDAKSHTKTSRSTASVDVREQNDFYTVRINLPGRDIGEVAVDMVDGNKLRIVAPAAGNSGRYEQTLVFDGLPADPKPQIDKKPKDHLIIVQIPKIPSVAESEPKSPEPKVQPLPAPLDRWDRDILERMDRMRREMDDMFNQAFKDFNDMPEFSDLFDHARLSSSVELREEGSQYIVRAYLPECDMENVKVVVDDGRILKIDAMAEETTGSGKDKGGVVMKRKAHYSQMITLPGPVDGDQLKVDRKQGMMIITLPKVPKT